MRRKVRVSIKWEARADESGNRYAILRWMGPDPKTGLVRRLTRQIGYQTPEQAEDLRHRHESSLVLEVASPLDGCATVGDVLTWYVLDLDRRPVSAGYGDGELARCETLRRHLGVKAHDRVTSQLLSQYLGDRRRERSRLGRPPKRSSLLMELDTLRRAYRSAIERRLIAGPIPSMPTGKLPQDRRPARRLTEAEVSRLIVAGHATGWGLVQRGGHEASPGLGWLVQTLAWSGRRPVAVLELTVEDVARLRDETLPREQRLCLWRRDKGGEALGWGPVTEPAREALVARAEEVGTGPLWAFGSAKGMWKPFQRAALEAGVPGAQPYDLRRHAVTRILDGCGWNLKMARAFTGHSRDETLLRYAYLPEGSAEAVAGRIGWTPETLRLVAGQAEEDE